MTTVILLERQVGELHMVKKEEATLPVPHPNILVLVCFLHEVQTL